jgi:methylmalonyl-CoA mutase N-terminal domain/subunit
VNRYVDLPPDHLRQRDGGREGGSHGVEGGRRVAPAIDTLKIDPAIESRQVARVRQVRAARDQSRWRAALDAVASAARGADNLVPPIIAAVEAHATVGEISDTMRGVFGEHREIDV